MNFVSFSLKTDEVDKTSISEISFSFYKNNKFSSQFNLKKFGNKDVKHPDFVEFYEKVRSLLKDQLLVSYNLEKYILILKKNIDKHHLPAPMVRLLSVSKILPLVFPEVKFRGTEYIASKFNIPFPINKETDLRSRMYGDFLVRAFEKSPNIISSSGSPLGKYNNHTFFIPDLEDKDSNLSVIDSFFKYSVKSFYNGILNLQEEGFNDLYLADQLFINTFDLNNFTVEEANRLKTLYCILKYQKTSSLDDINAPTQSISYLLLYNGYSIKEVAKLRNFQETSIHKHLAYCIMYGFYDTKHLEVSQDIEKDIIEVFKKTKMLSSVRSSLHLEYDLINYVLIKNRILGKVFNWEEDLFKI